MKKNFKFNDGLEVYYLEEEGVIEQVVEHLVRGDILAMDMGDAYGFAFNPHIENLAHNLTVLRGREKNQYYSVVAAYDYLCQEVIDRERVNLDFFKLNEKLCSQMMVRVPYDCLAVSGVGNSQDRSLQSFSFNVKNEHLAKLRQAWINRGLTYIAGASCNLHLLPTIIDGEEAEKLCLAMNHLAEAVGIQTKFVTVHLRREGNIKRAGSYPIFSFMNPKQIEILRLTNKSDHTKTEELRKKIEAECNLSTPIVYCLQ